MPIISYIFLAVFVVFTTIHLIASWKMDKQRRNFSKGYILLSLLGLYCTAVDEIDYIVVVAIVTSWLGDLFLIPKGTGWFTVGGVFFLISHLFFAWAYAEQIVWTAVPIWAVVLVAIPYAVTVIIVFSHLAKYLPKVLFYPMMAYLFINGTMNVFAIMRCISCFNVGTLLTAIGALGFFISDSNLFFVRFNKDKPEGNHFVVMLTYSLGELLIVLGLIFG